MDERQRKGIADAFRPLINLGAALQGSTLTQATGDPNAGAALRQFGQAQTSMLEDMWFRREAEIFSKRHGEKYKAEIERAQNEYKMSIVSERIPIKTKEDFERLEKTAPPGTLIRSEDSKGLQITDEKGNPAYGYVEAIFPDKKNKGQYFIPGSVQAIEYSQKKNAELMERFKNSTMQYLDAAGGITNDGGQTVVSKNNPYISESANRVVSGVSGFINMLTDGPRRVMQEQMQRAELYNAQQKMPFEREKMQLDAQIAREQMATQLKAANIGQGAAYASVAERRAERLAKEAKKAQVGPIGSVFGAALGGGDGTSSPNTPAPAPATAPGPGAMNDPNMSQDQLQLIPGANQSVGQSYTQNAPDQGRVPDMTLQAGAPQTPIVEQALQKIGLLPGVANADEQMPNTSTPTGPVTSMPPGGRAEIERNAKARPVPVPAQRPPAEGSFTDMMGKASGAAKRAIRSATTYDTGFPTLDSILGVASAPAALMGGAQGAALGSLGKSAVEAAEAARAGGRPKSEPVEPVDLTVSGVANPLSPRFKVYTQSIAEEWSNYQTSLLEESSGARKYSNGDWRGAVPGFKRHMVAAAAAAGQKITDKEMDILLANSGDETLAASSDFSKWTAGVVSEIEGNDDLKRAIARSQAQFGIPAGPEHPAFVKAYKEAHNIKQYMDRLTEYVAPDLAKQKEIVEKSDVISKLERWVNTGETDDGDSLSDQDIVDTKATLKEYRHEVLRLEGQLTKIKKRLGDGQMSLLNTDTSVSDSSLLRNIRAKSSSKEE